MWKNILEEKPKTWGVYNCFGTMNRGTEHERRYRFDAWWGGDELGWTDKDGEDLTGINEAIEYFFDMDEIADPEPGNETQEPKRLFQVLDEMNVCDIENNSRLVSISNTLISADKVKQGAKICMGAEEQVLYDLLLEKAIALLVLVDKKEYHQRKKPFQFEHHENHN